MPPHPQVNNSFDAGMSSRVHCFLLFIMKWFSSSDVKILVYFIKNTTGAILHRIYEYPLVS